MLRAEMVAQRSMGDNTVPLMGQLQVLFPLWWQRQQDLPTPNWSHSECPGVS